jgi:hypothetical protein
MTTDCPAPRRRPRDDAGRTHRGRPLRDRRAPERETNQPPILPYAAVVDAGNDPRRAVPIHVALHLRRRHQPRERYRVRRLPRPRVPRDRDPLAGNAVRGGWQKTRQPGSTTACLVADPALVGDRRALPRRYRTDSVRLDRHRARLHRGLPPECQHRRGRVGTGGVARCESQLHVGLHHHRLDVEERSGCQRHGLDPDRPPRIRIRRVRAGRHVAGWMQPVANN